MTYIEELLRKTYQQCVNSLLAKYGMVAGDYFLDEQCQKKNTKITRGKEGLYIHHIDEDKAIMLSTPAFAIKRPFSFQKYNRLVYCNLLEHLVLHIKIWEHPKPQFHEAVGVGGISNFIVPELNDIYSGIEYKMPWKQKVVEVVKPLKGDYLKCIEYLAEREYPYPLLKNYYFNEKGGLWSNDKNEKLYKEMRELGVKE